MQAKLSGLFPWTVFNARKTFKYFPYFWSSKLHLCSPKNVNWPNIQNNFEASNIDLLYKCFSAAELINTPLTALGLLSLHGNCWNSHQGLHKKLRVKCYTKTPIKWSRKHLIQKDVLCSPKVLDHGGNLIPCVINYEVILI